MRFKIDLPAAGTLHKSVPISSRYCFVDSALGEFDLLMKGKEAIPLNDKMLVDFGAGYEPGQDLAIRNASGAVNAITLHFSPVKIERNEQSGVMPVSIQSPLPVPTAVSNFPAVQAVSLPPGLILDVKLVAPVPVKIEEDYPARKVKTGFVEIPAGGSVALDFSGCYGFTISPAQDCFWSDYDLSQKLDIQCGPNVIAAASGNVTGPVGTLVRWLRVD